MVIIVQIGESQDQIGESQRRRQTVSANGNRGRIGPLLPRSLTAFPVVEYRMSKAMQRGGRSLRLGDGLHPCLDPRRRLHIALPHSRLAQRQRHLLRPPVVLVRPHDPLH
jgi:hypothetical protein